MAFDLAKNAWRRLQDMPSALDHLNPVVDGRFVWMAGGFKEESLYSGLITYLVLPVVFTLSVLFTATGMPSRECSP
jgi:hypothetical protein